MNVFERLESEVRSYSRHWPVIFSRAKDSWLFDVEGKPYLDFFAGAGALNYGHNNHILKQALIDYLERDGVAHALDMWTEARAELLESLKAKILDPRGLDYKVVFPGPGGANAVDAALKLARKATGKKWIAHFRNGFHGMTMGALSVSGKLAARRSAGVPLRYCSEFPYDSHHSEAADFECLLAESAGGLTNTAAVIVESVQGEGGINVARMQWLLQVAAVCQREKIVFIVDDIQMGCGRTGPFFSFEEAELTPDIVCLSKSISGYGLPLALLLIRRDLDVWKPAEHNGTFRGCNLAFVTATQAIQTYWSDQQLEQSTLVKQNRISDRLLQIRHDLDSNLVIRGKGLVWGLCTHSGEWASRIRQTAFKQGLLVETCGPLGETVKLLPPLTVGLDEIDQALDTIEFSIKSTLVNGKKTVR